MAFRVRMAASFALWLVVAAVSGCASRGAHIANGLGIPDDKTNGERIYVPPTGSRDASVHYTLNAPTSEYERASAMLDVVYRSLANRLNLAQQLALSGDQTSWLNAEQKSCGSAGVIDYACNAREDYSRAAVLAARKAALPDRMATSAISLPLPLPTPPPPPPSAGMQAAGLAGAQLEEPAKVARIYYVPVTAMPWLWKPHGENQAFQFGYPNGTAPVAVQLAALGASPGDTLIVRYAGGDIGIGRGGPSADASGYSGLHQESGPLGNLPGKYVQGDPVNLGALVGVFADDKGNILGVPFEVGAGSVTVQVPRGAARLQLGINDDVFGGTTPETRNTGGFKVMVLRGAG